MNMMHIIELRGIALSFFMVAMLVGCESAEQSVESTENQTTASQSAGAQKPLSRVMEFDGFTLRANVSPTEFLPEAMARQHGIQPDPDLVLLNLVILENRPGAQQAPVSAEVRARYETLIGHVQTVDMRTAETNGNVSYIGTLDTSTQQSFQLIIEAQPAGVDQLLEMSFEVQL